MTFSNNGDPGPGNDSTQGFNVDGLYFNPLNKKTFRCHKNDPGAADWRDVVGDPPRVITSSGVMVATDTVLLLESAGGVVTIGLVSAALFKDRFLRVIHTVPTSGAIIDPFENELIQGGPTLDVLFGDGIMRSVNLFCDGTAWFIA